jgi:hypothetical protein
MILDVLGCPLVSNALWLQREKPVILSPKLFSTCVKIVFRFWMTLFLSLIMYPLLIKHGDGRLRSFHRSFIAGKNRTKWGIFQQAMFDYPEGIM